MISLLLRSVSLIVLVEEVSGSKPVILLTLTTIQSSPSRVSFEVTEVVEASPPKLLKISLNGTGLVIVPISIVFLILSKPSTTTLEELISPPSTLE